MPRQRVTAEFPTARIGVFETLQRNIPQAGDALPFMRSLPDACAPVVFFDPQFREVLDKLAYGNEGARQRERSKLPAMTSPYIDAVCREIARVLRPSGYCMRWVDTYGLCEGHHLRIADALKCVDLIAWDSLRQGNGYRSRRRGDYLLALQKPPLRAKATWRDHAIPSRWVEKIDLTIYPRDLYPHAKPIELIKRLIAAVSEPGDLVVDPAAGCFAVLQAALGLGRNFVGCDINYQQQDKSPPGADLGGLNSSLRRSTTRSGEGTAHDR
jgi:site-specific DNA-methyltransferase (adenine-specific)